jgi:hypothetical protein
MDLGDVTKGLGLDESDREKIERLLAETRAEWGASEKTRVPRVQFARGQLSEFLMKTKRIAPDVRMEVRRRAMEWWRKYGQTTYEGKPMIRAIVTKSQCKSPTLLKSDRMVGKKGGPFIGPKGGKWADPKHTIPWKEGGQERSGAKHEEPTGREQAAGVEDGQDGEGTEITKFKLQVSGAEHAEMAKKLEAGIEKGANLCKMSPPVCHGNLGIDRGEMPQLDDAVLPEFLKAYQAKGVSVTKGTVEVGRLKATQKNILAETAQGMANSYAEGSFDPSKKPIIISKDGYVLDGHHRWAAMLVTDPASKMRVFQVDVPIQTLLKDAAGFKGVKQEAFGANAPGKKNPPQDQPQVSKALKMEAIAAGKRDRYLRGIR